MVAGIVREKEHLSVPRVQRMTTLNHDSCSKSAQQSFSAASPSHKALAFEFSHSFAASASMANVSPEVMEANLEEGKKLSNFSWRSVHMTVDMNKQKKTILDGITGSLKGGEVCALMGPSGAGKTSLLNVLAGRVRTRGKVKVDGNILLDGQAISGSSLRKRIAYVMQQDILTPTQTVRESLWFSANLRLPNSYSRQDKLNMVEKMLKDLGLEKCADTYIGDDMIRGVSGGEKKRTCVGIELIMKPKLIFLDEPTSGLDSYAAHNVVMRLKDMAHHDGCNVLCTIHQPSSEADFDGCWDPKL